MDGFIQSLTSVWQFADLLVYAVGWIVTALFVLGGIITVIAWARGIARPLWRLGLGLSRREVYIVASSENCNSLSELLHKSSLFNRKNIRLVTSANDAKDLTSANLILLQVNGSPVSIEEVLQYKRPEAALVIYAKPNEITNWAALDAHRNISVTNLRGRLMTDLLNALMTTGYEKN
jgi:hypothetical protein